MSPRSSQRDRRVLVALSARPYTLLQHVAVVTLIQATCRYMSIKIALFAAMLIVGGSVQAQDVEPLPEMALGAADAPVTIIEYASMSCPHCATFHTDVFPDLKSNYIDTGKVYFIFREFPLNTPAFQASVLARCGGPSRFFGFIDILFNQLQTWAAGPDPLSELAQIGRLGGISNEKFQSCLRNKRITDGILKNRLTGEQTHKVASTPSFVVNGQMLVGVQDISQFDAVLGPLLEGKTPAAKNTAGPASQASSSSPVDDGSGLPLWAIIVIVVAIVGAGGAWVLIRRRGPSPT